MSGDSMSSFITAVTGTNGLSLSTMWGEVSNAIPLVVICVTFSLGFYIVRRLLKGTAKGKFKI